MKLLVISPTANPAHAEGMLATARRVGLEPVLYGLTSNHPHGKDYQGTDIVSLLKERTDAEVVMGVDAPDVAFLAGEAEILDKFSQFGNPFVMSAEREGVRGLDRTQEEIHRQCIAAGGYFAQPNIGCWIGEREYTLRCFNEAQRLYEGHFDDPEHPYSYDNHYQWLAMMKAWGGLPFEIDWHCLIFQSMNQAHLAVVEDGKRVFNKVTGTSPSVLHYNGDPTRGAFNKMVARLLGVE